MLKTVKRIVCPVDIYDVQPEAAEYALTLAKAFDAQLTVLYILEPLPPSYVLIYYGEHEEEVKQEVEAKMVEIMTNYFRIGQDKCEIVTGTAANKIVEVSEEYAADMIVMSSHGRSALGRMIYGSVTNKVLANTKIPVLVVHPKEQ